MLLGPLVRSGLFLIRSCLLMVGIVFGAQAELFKWQDEHGNWHFSDERPEDASIEVKSEQPTSPEPQQGSQDSQTAQDYFAQLSEQFSDEAPIAQVTLGVVTIEASLGSGSGFFITDQGHIVTNKHVVRPNQTKAFEQSRDKIDAAKYQFEKLKRELDQEKHSLRKFERQLQERRKELDAKGLTSNRSLAEEEYNGYKKNYERRKRDYEQTRRTYDAKKREFDKMNSEFSLKASLSGVAKRFKIIFKDDTETHADLIAVSKQYDLALLKLTDARTPQISVFQGGRPTQGTNVFAVGSPMGIRDSVTKGIITGFREGLIVTDTQILPGNSGGPLVLEDGQVIGVNTFKLAQEANRQGFGLAIPISVVEKEFSNHLPAFSSESE